MFRIIRDIRVRAYYKRQLAKQFRLSYAEETTPVKELFTAALDLTTVKFNIWRWDAERIVSNGR